MTRVSDKASEQSLECKEAAQSLSLHQAASNVTALQLTRQQHQDRLLSWRIPHPSPIQKAM